jgi:hypothetical protein
MTDEKTLRKATKRQKLKLRKPKLRRLKLRELTVPTTCGTAQSSRFTFQGTSISNGTTAIWITGENWGEPPRNKRSGNTPHPGEPLFINERPEQDAEWQRIRDEYHRLKQALAER